MNHRGTVVLGTLAAALALFVWLGRSGEPTADAQWALLDRYCVDCHNEGEFAGGVAFDTLDRDDVAGHGEVWEAAVRKLRARMMPPPGEPRPEPARLDSLAAWLENTLDDAALGDPNPGAPALHRLNRAEYANAIRDLLQLPVGAATLLPGDDSRDGFDNIASALSVSPAHMQAYVAAAAEISRLAVGDPTTSPEITTYTAPRGLSQAEHLDGMPLGTRGGFLVEHVFPLDAEYEIRVRRAGGGFGLRAVGGDEPVEVTLNGARVRLLGRGVPASFVLPVEAGPHTLGAAIVRGSRPAGVNDLYAVHAGSTGVQALSIIGPLDASGAGDTPSRRRIFICEPAQASDEDRCATEILAALATRAFRRSVAASDPALGTLLEFYRTGRALGSFETAFNMRSPECSSIPSSSFASSANRRASPPAKSTRSADTSSPRVFPSSSGAASPTTPCSRPQPTAGSRRMPSSSARSSGCSQTPGRARSSRTSHRSGWVSGNSTP